MIRDGFLLANAPGPVMPAAPAVRVLRGDVARAAGDLLAIRDAALEADWPWREDEADVRYGLYRAIEAIEEAQAEASRVLRETGAGRPPGAERIAPSTIARWDLHGLLASLTDATLDAHPDAFEWTPRQTLAHIVASQRGYGWYTAWWAARSADEPVPDRVPEAVIAANPLPDDELEGVGSVAEIRARLDEILDLSAGSLANLDDAALARPARWAGIPVTVGFRLGRWSSHLIEHTVQLDKTLATLGRRPTEVERVVRHIHAAHGRLEALVFPIEPDALATPDGHGRTVDGILSRLGTELVAEAASARAAAGA
jgi:hypothetical protein